jgi:SNF2 family DNA or RNA helicase
MSNYQLKPHQVDALNYARKNFYSIIRGGIGSGKTLVGLELAKGYEGKTLIVVPSMLIKSWEREIKKWMPELDYCIFSKGDEIQRSSNKVALISYDLCTHKNASMLFAQRKQIIFDEVHYLKNPKAARTDKIHRLIFENNTHKCTLMSGTILTNRVWEFYSPIAICNYNPDCDGGFLERFKSYKEFADFYSFKHEYKIQQGKYVKTVIKYSGFKNEGLLSQWLKNIYFGITTESAVKGLLEPIERFIEVDYGSLDLPELESAFKEFVETEKGIKPQVKLKAAWHTADFTIRYAKELFEGGIDKIIIITDHLESCKKIANGLGVGGISGATTDGARDSQISAFLTGKANYLVGTSGTIGTGLNLQENCYNLIINDPCWMPGLLDQIKGRIYREGQKQRCNFHYIIGTKQSEHLYKTLKQKIEDINKVLLTIEGRKE